MKCLMVEANMEGMDGIRAFVRDQMNGIHALEANHIILCVELAVEEIFFAIVGNAERGGEEKVEICMEVNEKIQQVVITLSSSGLPFNPLRYRQPEYGLEAGLSELDGLGYRILDYIDRLRHEYRAGKNVITISKRW